jgi:hypothetical protein
MMDPTRSNKNFMPRAKINFFVFPTNKMNKVHLLRNI